MEWSMLMVWIIVIIAAVGIDIMTSAMIFIWFALGALGAIIAYVPGASVATQVIVFCILSIIGLVVGYPISKKIIKKSVRVTKTMEQTYIGKEFTAEDDIVNSGHVKINGSYWTVINDGPRIQKGEKFKIFGIKGTKLVVSALEKINK